MVHQLLGRFTAVALLLVASACGTQKASSMAELDFGEDVPASEAEALRGAVALELISLQPDTPTSKEQLADPARFQGQEILGQATVTDAATMLKLLDLIARSCRENNTTLHACYSPRHGLRVDDGGSTVDLAICFECLQIKVARDGHQVHSGLLASLYEPEVSDLFRSAGLPVAPTY